MHFILLSPQSEQEYEQYMTLRWEYLRKPWGQAKETAQDDMDPFAHHVLAKTDDKIPAGVGRIHKINAQLWQIRFMAVADSFRGMGLGRKILFYLEQIALDHSADEIQLQAREPAVAFYSACGYCVREKSHLLFGEIQHFTMSKSLSVLDN